MRAASPPRQIERENEMIVISQLLFHSVMGESGRNESDFVYCPNLYSLATSHQLFIELRHSIDEVGSILDAGRLIGGVHGELGETDVYGRHGDDGV